MMKILKYIHYVLLGILIMLISQFFLVLIMRFATS